MGFNPFVDKPFLTNDLYLGEEKIFAGREERNGLQYRKNIRFKPVIQRVEMNGHAWISSF